MATTNYENNKNNPLNFKGPRISSASYEMVPRRQLDGHRRPQGYHQILAIQHEQLEDD